MGNGGGEALWRRRSAAERPAPSAPAPETPGLLARGACREGPRAEPVEQFAAIERPDILIADGEIRATFLSDSLPSSLMAPSLC